jgi:PilZ domain
MVSLSDRRILQRIPTGLKVLFGVSDPEFEGVIADISEEGVRIISKKYFNPPTALNIRIHLETDPDHPIIAEGEVRWSREKSEKRGDEFVEIYSMGVQLTVRPKRYLKYVRDFNQRIADRRIEPRFMKRCKIVYLQPKSREVEYTRDISRNGIFINTRDLLEMDSAAEIYLQLIESKRLIHAKGLVFNVYDEETAKMNFINPGIWLRFTWMFEDGQAVLDEYIDSLIAKSPLNA